MSNARLKLDEILLTLTQPGGPYEIEERDLAGIRHKLYRNAPATLLDIYESSAQAADYDFIHYEQDSWSRQRLLDGAAAVSAFLRDNIGIEKGDRVAIAMRNCPEWMVAFIAITDLGAIAVPLNSWCKQQELDYMLRDSGAKFAFCDEPRYQHLQAIAADYPLQLAVVGASDRPVDAYRFEELCQAAHQPFSRALSLVGPEDPAMILYTSGTTGFPKGACSSHRAVTQSLYNLEVMGAAMTLMNQELNTDKPASSKQPPEIPRHTVLLALPLFHVSGLHTGFLNSLRSQIRIVIMPKWDAGKALKLIESGNGSTGLPNSHPHGHRALCSGY